MKKYYRRKRLGRKKIFRKKRIYRKRYSRPKPDGEIVIKVKQTYIMNAETIVGPPVQLYAALCVNWGNGIDAPGGTPTAKFSNVNEFVKLSALYNDYKLKGLKMSVIPFTLVTSVDPLAAGPYTSGLTHIEYHSNTRHLVTGSVGDNLVRSAIDYKVLPALRPFKRYIKLSKYYGKRNFGWVNVTGPITYPDSCSLIRVFSTGFPDGTPVARADITWYIALRAPEIA